MNIRIIPLLALCVATHLARGATTQSPDTLPRLPPVTVGTIKTVPAVRFDVRGACPRIDTELQKMLSPAWGRVQNTGTFPVQLRVEGDRVTLVTSSVSAMPYRPYLRAAFAKLDCVTGSAEAQDFRFLLTIRDPEDLAIGHDIALLQDK